MKNADYLCYMSKGSPHSSFFILKVFHQDIPYGDDMADAAGEDEEMKDAVHVFPLVEAVEHGPRDIADAFGDNPRNGSRTNTVDQRLEGHEDAQPHSHEAAGLQIAVVLEPAETHHRAHYGTRPDEHEQSPSPSAVLPQCHESQRRVAAGDVPVYCGVVPLAQTFLPHAARAQGVVYRGGDIRAQHSEQIERHAGRGPCILVTDAEYEEGDAHADTHHDAAEVRPGIPKLLLVGEMYFHFHDCLFLFIIR